MTVTVKTTCLITRPNPKWTFPVYWTLATIIGWVLSDMYVFDFVSGKIYEFIQLADIDTYLHFPFSIHAAFGFLSIGLVIGFFQQTVVKKYLSDSLFWVFVTALAFPFAFVGLDAILPTRSKLNGYLVFVVIALSQWLYLRTQLPRSHYWIVMHIIMIVAGLLLLIIFPEGEQDCCVYPIEVFLDSLVLGSFMGIPTGFVLFWLIRQRNL